MEPGMGNCGKTLSPAPPPMATRAGSDPKDEMPPGVGGVEAANIGGAPAPPAPTTTA
jgi:hypothetical protein